MEKVKLTLPGQDDYFTQEAYKVLRTNLQFCGQKYRVIMLTSCEENEGKTSVSLHLAKSFADQGKTVLVVDADLRKSVMAGRNTNIRYPKGLSEVLSGLNPLEESIRQTEYPGLDILFAGKCPPNPVELLGSAGFQELIEDCKAKYDYILVDTPPLGRVIDAAVVAPVCDGLALVLNDQKVRYKQLREVIAQLEKSNTKVLGVIRNQHKRAGGNDKYYRYGRQGR